MVWLGGGYFIIRQIIGTSDPLLNKVWVLQSINNNEVKKIDLIFIKDKWFIGDDGCNSFIGLMERNGNTIAVSKVIQTDYICRYLGETDIDEFLEGLESAFTFNIEDDLLTIGFDDGEMRFQERESRGDYHLEEVDWQLLWMGTPFEVEISYFETFNDPFGRAIILRYENDLAHAYSGCNQMEFNYSVSGDNIEKVERGFSTLLYCADLTDFEERYFDFLSRESIYGIYDNILVIYTSDEMMVFVATR